MERRRKATPTRKVETMDNGITLQDGDVFQAVYNGKARVAKVLRMLKDDECANCAILDPETLEPLANEYRNFTIAKLESLELIQI